MASQFFKKQIKKVAIIYRSNSAAAKSKSQELCDFLKNLNISSQAIRESSIKEATKSNYDFVVSLGGDGTYLKAAYYIGKKNIPLLGVHMGSLGFLSPHPEKSLFSVIEKTLKGKMFIKKHSFILAQVYKKNKNQLKLYKTFQAINDVVLERGSLSQLISISIHVNKQFIYSVKSDGVIVSSPLGSTAYNLAAGGPILHPNVESFVITPVSSHSLTDRPIVLHNNSDITLELQSQRACLTVDGRSCATLKANEVLSIKKDKGCFYSLTEKQDPEFYLLKEKLKFGERN